MKKILVVDSVSLVRRYIVKLLTESGYEAYSVKNEQELFECMDMQNYNLILFDMTMPNALEILRNLLRKKALRVLLLTQNQDDVKTMEAFELGAIESIIKPKKSVDIAKISEELLKKVKKSLTIIPQKRREVLSSFTLHKTEISDSIDMGFVLIGSSTGGPRLIEQICKTLPPNYPHAVCIVQHMPTDFTANFARRLNTLSKLEVLEAENGMELKSARIIIAKGGKHLHIRKKLKTYSVILAPNTRERFFVPSVDELFFSALEVLPAKKILAIELTGIGDDGADGMVALRKKGAYTLAENEESAVVYGMPKEAYERGGVDKSLPFNAILDEIIHFGQKYAVK